MSKKSKVAKATAAKQAKDAAEAVSSVRSNPYVQRVVEDDDLRDNVRVAYESAQSAFNRLTSGKDLPKQIVKDKKLHSDLQSAADALRDIGESLVDAPKRSKPKTKKRGRRLLVLVAGAGLAIALSEGLRNKVLDALFGAEEEFDYTSTTTPSTPAPASPSVAPAN